MRKGLLNLLLLVIVLVEGQSDKPLPPGHLKPIGHSGPNIPVEEASGFVKPAVFVENYMKQHRPLVMRGAVKDVPAFQKWNDAYLRAQTPEGKSGNVFIEHGKKENRSDPSEDIHFSTFLDRYNTSDIYMVHHVPAFIASDVIMPFSIQCDSFNKNFADTVMWFSSGGTKSVLHNDHFENINCLYRGRKHLVMANVTKYKHMVDKILDVVKLGHSSVDVEKVDLIKYPFFVGMEFHVVDMEAGDCLYIPTAWLHHVASTGSNLAVNVWLLDSAKVDVTTCLDTFDRSRTLDKFTFNMKDGDDDDEGGPEKPKVVPAKAKPVVEKPKTGATVDVIIENIGAIVMNKKNVASKSRFLARMSGGKKLTEDESRLLNAIFKVLDSNKNGRFDIEDFEAELPKKTGDLLVKTATMWQVIADAHQLKYNLFQDREAANQKQEPKDDPTIYSSLSDRDEL